MRSSEQIRRCVALCPECGGTGIRGRLLEDLSMERGVCPLCDGRGECMDTRDHRMVVEVVSGEDSDE